LSLTVCISVVSVRYASESFLSGRIPDLYKRQINVRGGHPSELIYRNCSRSIHMSSKVALWIVYRPRLTRLRMRSFTRFRDRSCSKRILEAGA